MTFLTWTAFLVGTRMAVSRAATQGGAMEMACTWAKNLSLVGWACVVRGGAVTRAWGAQNAEREVCMLLAS